MPPVRNFLPALPTSLRCQSAQSDEGSSDDIDDDIDETNSAESENDD